MRRQWTGGVYQENFCGHTEYYITSRGEQKWVEAEENRLKATTRRHAGLPKVEESLTASRLCILAKVKKQEETKMIQYIQMIHYLEMTL